VNFNEEQIRAVTHTGGLSLSAGAGSGKTTVIVGHVIYKIQKFLDSKGTNLTSIELSDFLKKIVVMTYTKKAAAELETRLKKEIGKLNSHNAWAMVEKLSSSVYVGTIHGFCASVLKAYGSNILSPNFEIISEIEKELLIEKQADNWLDQHRDKIIDFNFFSANYYNLIAIMQTVFADAELRLRWQKNKPENRSEEFFLSELFSILPILKEVIISPVDDLPSFLDEKWHDGLKNVVKERGYALKSLANFSKFMSAVLALNYRSKPKASDFPECRKIYELLQEFKDDFVKKFQDSIEANIAVKTEVLNAWDGHLKQLFDYLEKEQKGLNFLTFSDLEFFTHKLLQDKQIAAKVAAEYDYFIIDEFQDTSNIQLTIIEGLIQKDYKKLFVVGDLKQAIYGFRGGEVAVFESVIAKTELLELNHNYRSSDKIVNFNNVFFSSVLNSGLDYLGEARNKIRVTSQLPIKIIPEEVVGVYALQAQMPGKLSGGLTKQFEAQILLTNILEIIQKSELDSIVVLYRNLNPSQELIALLKKEQISFRAQIKIDRKEEPIWGIFEIYLAQITCPDEKNMFILKNILQHLEARHFPEVNIKDVQYFGLYNAFINYLEQCALSISSYKSNLEHIEKIVSIANENINEITKYLHSYFDVRDAAFIEYGNNTNKLTIMTVHASKGLEFDHVLLGGISDNSRSNSRVQSVGSWPGAYRFKNSFKEKKLFPSLPLILETIENKFKESAEMKRLFYVACTRAKKSLSWPEMLKADGKISKFGGESWINALLVSKDNNIINSDLFTQNTIDLSGFSPSQALPMPSYIDNWVGVVPKEKSRSVDIYSELSVTNFISIADCPRKFYFKNICKLDEEMPLNLESDETVQIISSKSRGTFLHKQLENFIKYSEDFSGAEFIKKIIVEKKKKYKLFSECDVKFSIPQKKFGQMVSGSLDLLLVPFDKSDHFEIWDFKTGQRKNNEDQYFSQLFLYAFAIFEQFKIDQNCQMNLKIIYLDSNEIIEKLVNSLEIKIFVSNLWIKTNQLSQTNLKHCPNCEYQSICTKN